LWPIQRDEHGNEEGTMKKGTWICVWVVGLTAVVAAADTYTIPPEKVDNRKVYYGVTSGFQKAAEVDYQSVLKATPEYTQLQKKKVETGSAKYWILISQASDHAVRTISEVGQEQKYDLVVARGYLQSFEPPIPAEDITALVLRRLQNKKK
jgi:Skp family chaperone for outer membrane proteins